MWIKKMISHVRICSSFFILYMWNIVKYYISCQLLASSAPWFLIWCWNTTHSHYIYILYAQICLSAKAIVIVTWYTVSQRTCFLHECLTYLPTYLPHLPFREEIDRANTYYILYKYIYFFNNEEDFSCNNFRFFGLLLYLYNMGGYWISQTVNGSNTSDVGPQQTTVWGLWLVW